MDNLLPSWMKCSIHSLMADLLADHLAILRAAHPTDRIAAHRTDK